VDSFGVAVVRLGVWLLSLGRGTTGSLVLRSETDIDAFRGFVVESEPRPRQALSAALGTQAGRDATADAIGYARENWERIQPVGQRERCCVCEQVWLLGLF